jgi:hypothetical protein|tara:strand:+ start:706 stop:945 length:240 start_codon:yes stop_codon:yes gene_type:complete
METIFTKIQLFISNLTALMMCLLSFGVLAEVLFGSAVLGMSVIDNVVGLINTLGNNGVVGVIAIVILYELLSCKAACKK